MKIAIQILRYLPFVALFFTAVSGAADAPKAAKTQMEVPTPVEKIRTMREGDVFTMELITVNAWNPAEAKIQFNEDSVQIDFPQTFLDKGKQLVKVEDRVFRSVYTTQSDASTVRAKLSLNEGLSANSLSGLVQIRKNAAGITISITGDASEATGKEVKSEVMTIAVNEEGGGGEALSTKLVAGAVAPAVIVPAAAETKAEDVAAVKASKLPESEIPVLTTTKAAKKEEGGGFGRLMTTLGVLTVVLGAAAFGVRKYSRKVGTKSLHTNIKIITQHHLGPKKSLAIVQVAGESILIGITDQNISMLKSLSLIDDEIPVEIPARFEQAMDNVAEPQLAAPTRRGLLGMGKSRPAPAILEEDESEDFMMQGLNEIQDVVTTRLKNMRNF
ncbi:MAG: flagellar biosynthetic protein FliO [Bdellovibrionota bacterium]